MNVSKKKEENKSIVMNLSEHDSFLMLYIYIIYKLQYHHNMT